VTYPAGDEHLSVARRLLSLTSMFRWLITLVLLVASATAWAQSGSPASATAKAQEVAAAAERKVTTLLGQKGPLAVRYEGELRAIDRLKQQKKTWNRERELKEKLATANETAKQLNAIEAQLTAAQQQLVGARRVLVGAIDAELATKPTTERARVLQRLRDQILPQVKRANVHRIAIPNLEVDPSADPEDLDAQAAELRRIEAELQRQIDGLDKQSKKLATVAELRRGHDRAKTFDVRDDNTPSRTQTTSESKDGRGNGATAETQDSPSAPDNAGGTGGAGNDPPPAGDPSFEADAKDVLANVIDPTTIDTLTTAQLSGDPDKRSKAAAKTRDAVQKKLELLKQKRALIEQRAKQLRK
jgi:hypothetical protein